MGGKIKHGHSIGGVPTRTYRCWKNMRTRCRNPNTHNYNAYGGRGIVVCPAWDLFENFLLDMGEVPSGHSIDRIDNDGNYEPGNCRWATRYEQKMNTSFIKLTEDAVREIRSTKGNASAKQLANKYNVNWMTVMHIRSGYNWSKP